MTDEPMRLSPTASQIGVAIELTQLHTKATFRADCAWCSHAFPCPDRRWSDHILMLARLAGREV